ncbi:galactose-binding domain-containing protein [Cohnella endophytica]|nr:discoidin domain-containing protein [Cohnella endophytica]
MRYLRTLILVLGISLMLGISASLAMASSSQTANIGITSSTGWDIFTPNSSLSADYRYGPSFIVNADASIDMWSCSPGSTTNNYPWDYLRYTRSTDGGHTWSADQLVSLPTAGSMDALSTCDPGIIKFGGYYYLAYDSTTNRGGVNNQIYVARSSNPNGPFDKWNGTGWGGETQKPQPFIAYDGSPLVYGAGGVSFVVNGTTLYIYYTWVDNNMNQTRLATASTTDANWPGSVSLQGVVLNKGPGEDHTDIKYVDSLGKFVALTTNQWGSANSYLNMYSSTDGYTFTKEYQMNGDPVAKASNSGLSGDASGHIKAADQKFLSYAVGDPTNYHWTTRLSPISFASLNSGYVKDDFQAGLGNWTTYGGAWTVSGGELVQSSTAADPGYAAASNYVFGDATYETDLQITAAPDTGNWAGIQLGKTIANDTWSASGYLVFLRANGNLGLYKAGTGQVVSDTATGYNPMTGRVHLKVVKSGDNIKVFVGTATTPQINYTDSGVPFTSGFFGVVTKLVGAHFDNLTAQNNIVEDFQTSAANWTASAGTWAVSSGVYRQSNTASDPGYSTYNKAIYGDSVIEADLKINSVSAGGWVGVSFGQSNIGDAYYTSGYMVFVDASGNVSMYKGGIGGKVAYVPQPTGVNPLNWFHLKIVKSGKNIQVFVGNVSSPQLYYNDPADTPVFGSGYAGVVNVKSDASFDNFTIDTQKSPGGTTGMGASDLPNVALGKTVTSNDSLVLTDWGLNKLTDNIEAPAFGSYGYTSSAYGSNNVSSSPIYLEVDLGSNQRLIDIKLFPRIYVAAVGGGSPNYPVDFTIQVKPDGGSYSTVKTITNGANPADFPVEYYITPTTARYVRIVVTKLGTPSVDDPGSYRLQLEEIQVIQHFAD